MIGKFLMDKTPAFSCLQQKLFQSLRLSDIIYICGRYKSLQKFARKGHIRVFGCAIQGNNGGMWKWLAA